MSDHQRRRPEGERPPRQERSQRTDRSDRSDRTDRQRGQRNQRHHRPRGPRPLTQDQLNARRATADALTITYPDLPVSARREDIAAALADHQVIVVAGETGSGKTTQLPKIALELGRGITGTIGHTQPRRIAARAVADRIAEELGVELGQAVGYQVRFTDKVSQTSLVKVMTDGILLAEIQRDPELRQYDTIIVDEAHERSLNIDFILGYLRRLLPRRPDLKVVITSATIDTERFAAHFRLGPDGLVVPHHGAAEADNAEGTPAPIVEVSGRTYPVEIRYRPLVADRHDENEDDDELAPAPAEDLDQPTAICQAVDELIREGSGDILVFCSGEREIRDAADALRDHLGARFTHPGETNTTPGAVEVLPLYARLSAAEQHRVFERHRYRRVVLSTNVAETSLTVPGIHYVIDTGYARISRYSHRTKVQRLPIEPVSQASANQRSGRSGRVADGIAIRLYSETDFERRPEFTEPEILRTSLASVILQMAALGLGRMEDFPFVEPPELRAIRDGVTLLTELGAIAPDSGGTSQASGGTSQASGGTSQASRGTSQAPGDSSQAPRLTRTGRILAQLPIDPRLGRMLIEADRLGVVDEVMVIVSALSAQDVRERPLDAQQQADESHRRFNVPGSDLLALVVLWDYLMDQQSLMGSSAFRRMCRREYLHFLRVREWQDVHSQLRQLAGAAGIKGRGTRQLTGTAEPGTVRRRTMDDDGIHQAVLSGLLSHIGSWDERRREYAGARGARFVPWPGSSLARKPPGFVMAAELVETSRLFGRQNARIQPEWAEKLADHLVKRSYSEPYWSSKQGAAMCHEKVTLFGVPIVADRIVPYAKVDPALAREMFIRHALVEDAWTTHHRFVARNRELRADAADLAERTRRLDLIVDEERLVDFFDERIPETVTTARAFDAWWKDARRATPTLLDYDLDLLVPGHAEVDQSGLPSTWHQRLVGGGDLELPLTYQFTPAQTHADGREATPADGVTVHVPIAVLPRLRPEGFDWLVPELLPELATATIRALPKAVRVQLVPAPDTAHAALEHLPAWTDVAPAPEDAPSFHDAFRTALRAVRPDADIPPDAFDDVAAKLPPHLRMTFRVVGERGAIMGESTDLPYLQRRLAAQSQSAVQSAVRRALKAAGEQSDARAGARGSGTTTAKAVAGLAGAPRGTSGADGRPSAVVPGPHPTGLTTAQAVELDRVTTWADLKDRAIPRSVSTVVGGLEVKGYPALVVEGVGAQRRVALRVLASAEEADAAHAAGVRELLLADLALPEGRVTSRWTGREALTLASSPYRNTAELVRDVQAAAIAQLTAQVDLVDVRDEIAYRTVRSDVRDHLEDTVYRVVARAVEALVAFRELEAQVRRTTSMTLLRVLQEVREHAASLVYPGFIAATPPERLRDLVRYLRADSARLEKAAVSPDRDATLAWEVEQLAGEIDAVDAPSLSPVRKARVREIRWMLEELRVSLFAQQLGTRETVSAKRIRKALATL